LDLAAPPWAYDGGAEPPFWDAKKRLSSEIAAEIAEHATDGALTPREVTVIGLVAAGNSNKEVAAQLSLTEVTVKSHLKNILSKLGANDRTHAVTIALKRGIIDLWWADILQKKDVEDAFRECTIRLPMSYADSGAKLARWAKMGHNDSDWICRNSQFAPAPPSVIRPSSDPNSSIRWTMFSIPPGYREFRSYRV
jgi:DNA-binding CsgD family transcriptional regulator